MNLGRFELNKISFNAADSECLALVGPNGSGKTTLLECVAGIRRIESGKIELNELDITYLPPEKRRVGYVPHDCLLFPHLTVDRNIAFGQRDSGTKAHDRVKKMMDWLGIPHLSGRSTRALSGGEKQKVALARALVTNPRLLLLDEPFSSVDRASKARLLEDMRKTVEEVSHTSGLTSIYVTHDLAEAQLMSSRVAIMNNGRVEQVGPWERVLQNPESTFVAGFMGFNMLRGTLTSVEDGFAIAEIKGKTVHGVATRPVIGEPVVAVVRPQAILLSLERDGAKPSWRHCRCNVLGASIVSVHKMGSVAQLSIDVGFPLNVETASDQVDDLNLAVGSGVFAHFRAAEVSFLHA